MTFQFRLEKALHFLRLRETVKKMEVASHLQRLKYLERRKELLEVNLRELLDKQKVFFSPEWAIYQTAKITQDSKEVSQVEAMLTQERTALDKKKAELASLLTKKKGLESLRERKYREFKQETGRKEQLELDEVFRMAQISGGG